jgi:hypothetical protein
MRSVMLSLVLLVLSGASMFWFAAAVVTNGTADEVFVSAFATLLCSTLAGVALRDAVGEVKESRRYRRYRSWSS